MIHHYCAAVDERRLSLLCDQLSRSVSTPHSTAPLRETQVGHPAVTLTVVGQLTMTYRAMLEGYIHNWRAQFRSQQTARALVQAHGTGSRYICTAHGLGSRYICTAHGLGSRYICTGHIHTLSVIKYTSHKLQVLGTKEMKESIKLYDQHHSSLICEIPHTTPISQYKEVVNYMYCHGLLLHHHNWLHVVQWHS